MTAQGTAAPPSAAHGADGVRAARRVRWRERVFGTLAPVLSPFGPHAAWTEGALILLYHRVLADDQALDPFAVDRRGFEAQVAYMAERFQLVTVGEIAAQIRAGGPTRGLAAFSFDDGYECTFSNAWPVLRAHGVTATLFVDTGRLGGQRPALTTEELKAMACEGLEVGSHTVSHPLMTRLAEPEAADEVERSRDALRRLTGQPVDGFAFPFGRYAPRDLTLLGRAGYRYACTCRQDRTNRVGDDVYRLTRVEVNDTDGERRFERKVDGRYARVHGLLHRFQSLSGAGV